MRGHKRKHERKVLKNIVTGAFDALAKLPFVQNKWISTDVWFKLAEQRLNICSEINESYFRRILFEKDSKISQNMSITSPDGYYAQSMKNRNGGKRQFIHAILATEPGILPALSQVIKWHAQVTMCIPPSWCTRSNCVSPTPPPAAPVQQRRRINSAISTTTVPDAALPIAALPNATISIASPAAPPVASFTNYWQSSDAKKIFGYLNPSPEDEEMDVREIVRQRIIRLRHGALTSDGWRHLLDDGDSEASYGSLTHSDLDLSLPEMSVRLVERLVKVYKSPHKCHRNIVDSEQQFLRKVAGWMKRECGSGAIAEEN